MNISSSFLHRFKLLASTSLLLIVICCVCVSFTFKAAPVTIWNQLGISESTGLENIKKSFIDGYLYTYGASAAKKLATGDRVAITNDLLLYCKSYVNSESFRKAYTESRIQHKPVKPADPKTKEDIQSERIASLQKSIDEGEKSMKTLPADLLEPFKEVQQMLHDQIKDFEDPESEMLKMMVEGEQMNYRNAMQQYEANLKAWENEYPEDHLAMVKNRLNKFLEVTADVDFDAALKEEYHKKKFVNPVYERKSAEWKIAYRSGKPTVDAARAFATEWVKEIK